MDLGLVSSKSPIKELPPTSPVNMDGLREDIVKSVDNNQDSSYHSSPVKTVGKIKNLSQNPVYGDISPKRRPTRILSPDYRPKAPIDDTPVEINGQPLNIKSIRPITIPKNINTQVDIVPTSELYQNRNHSVKKIPSSLPSILSPIKRLKNITVPEIFSPPKVEVKEYTKPKNIKRSKVFKKKRSKTKKSVIPDYEKMTKDEQCSYSSILDQRINHLKEKWPNYEFPNFAHLSVREKHIYYLSYLRHYNICNNIVIGRLILCALWVGIEVICNIFLGIQIVGFADRQMKSMDIYDRFLIEIQETMTPEINLEAGGSMGIMNSWEPIYKLLGVSALITVIIVIIALLVSKVPMLEPIIKPLGDKFISMFVGANHEPSVKHNTNKNTYDIPDIPEAVNTSLNIPILGDVDISNVLTQIGPIVSAAKFN